jgi:hypothetical protein
MFSPQLGMALIGPPWMYQKNKDASKKMLAISLHGA